MKWILFFILLFLFLLFYNRNKPYYIYQKNDKKVTFVFFLSKNELYQVLKNNTKFYDSLTIYDLISRGVSTKEEYIEKIKDVVENFDKEDEDKIKRLIKKANKYFKSINYEWFNGKIAAEIPWKFGTTLSTSYEKGFPHTVNDIIILNKNFIKKETDSEILKTIIHEKVHVYQKIIGAESYLSYHKFVKIKKKGTLDLIQANPDTDEYIYFNLNNKIKYELLYTNNDINDIEMYKYEHPFEEMAYRIENEYKNYKSY